MRLDDFLRLIRTGSPFADGELPPTGMEVTMLLTDDEMAAVRQALGLEPNARG
jgi:hypothetical protein